MSRKVIVPEGTAASGSPLSPGVVVGKVLFVSGQVAPEVDGVEGQTRAVLEKLGQVLLAAGSDYASVARCGVYLKNIGDFERMNAVYREFFPTDPPARSTIECAMARPDILVEVDCVAAVP